jgi:hypothetical protein
MRRKVIPLCDALQSFFNKKYIDKNTQKLLYILFKLCVSPAFSWIFFDTSDKSR